MKHADIHSYDCHTIPIAVPSIVAETSPQLDAASDVDSIASQDSVAYGHLSQYVALNRFTQTGLPPTRPRCATTH